uniref:Uncharacterized protein n=1 Tax=Acrobeloides nanus TaxID=290746 RepID=A0A914ERM3_9BILA
MGSPVKTNTPVLERHVDIDALLEEYAWKYFRDMVGIKKSGLENFRAFERDEAEFTINRKNLVVIHKDPGFSNLQQLGAPKPSTIFKSVFTNSTSQQQAYSLKAERTSENTCGISREQGYMFGAEAELTLKTPCEIAELKTAFKHEMHFNSLQENIKSEIVTWSMDTNIVVPPGLQTEASVVIDEMNYHGSYTIQTVLMGTVTIIIKRRRDGAIALPVTANISAIMQEFYAKKDTRLHGVLTIDKNQVILTSKGTCHFQMSVKQYVDLKESYLDVSAHTSRLRLNEAPQRR